MRTFKLSFFKGYSSNQPITKEVTWQDLVELLVPRQASGEKGEQLCISPCWFDGNRWDKNAQDVSLCILDFDNEPSSDVWEKLKSYEYISYPTWSHSKKGSCRVVLSLERPVNAQVFKTTFARNMAWLEGWDKAANPIGLYALPFLPDFDEDEHIAVHNKGEPFIWSQDSPLDICESKTKAYTRDVIHDGEGRYDAFVSKAGKLRSQGLPDDELKAALWVWQEQHLDPPYTENEFDVKSRGFNWKIPDEPSNLANKEDIDAQAMEVLSNCVIEDSHLRLLDEESLQLLAKCSDRVRVKVETLCRKKKGWSWAKVQKALREMQLSEDDVLNWFQEKLSENNISYDPETSSYAKGRMVFAVDTVIAEAVLWNRTSGLSKVHKDILKSTALRFQMLRREEMVSDIVSKVKWRVQEGDAEQKISDWLGLICDRSRPEFEIWVKCMHAWMYQTKLALLSGKERRYHIAPFFTGAQGGGKSLFIKRFTAPWQGLIYHSSTWDYLVDDRSAPCFQDDLIHIIDDASIKGYNKAQVVEALKSKVTGDTKSYRVMHTNSSAKIRPRCNFIMIGNHALTDVISDPTGMRRYVEIECMPRESTRDNWQAINEFDYELMWQLVDEHATHPYPDSEREALYEMQAEMVPENPIAEFVHQKCVECTFSEGMSSTELYQQTGAEMFMKSVMGVVSPSADYFGKLLKRAGYKQKRTSKKRIWNLKVMS